MSLTRVGSDRAYRGGSWAHGVQLARAAFRFAVDPSGRGGALGLRLLRRES